MEPCCTFVGPSPACSPSLCHCSLSSCTLDTNNPIPSRLTPLPSFLWVGMSAHLTGEEPKVPLEHLPGPLHQLPPEGTLLQDHADCRDLKKQAQPVWCYPSCLTSLNIKVHIRTKQMTRETLGMSSEGSWRVQKVPIYLVTQQEP